MLRVERLEVREVPAWLTMYLAAGSSLDGIVSADGFAVDTGNAAGSGEYRTDEFGPAVALSGEQLRYINHGSTAGVALFSGEVRTGEKVSQIEKVGTVQLWAGAVGSVSAEYDMYRVWVR